MPAAYGYLRWAAGQVLEALGNLGDFIGGIGVLVTLLYLASQIRQNSQSVRNAAAESVLQSMNSALQTASSSPQIARVIAVGQTNIEDLSEDERSQFLMWLYAWFRVLERGYSHYRRGYIDADEWRGHTMNLASVMKSESAQKWWFARRSYFGSEFAAMVDSLETSDAAPSIGELASIVSSSSQIVPPAV